MIGTSNLSLTKSKESVKLVQKILDRMVNLLEPKQNEIYKHFKGNLYRVLTIAIHSETEEKMVVYQGLYGDMPVYVRPLSMFMEPVDREKYPDSTQTMRFELVPGMDTSGLGEASVEKKKASKASETQKLATEEATDTKATTDNTTTEEGMGLDPGVEAFLDATTYEERLNILVSMQSRITNDMITTMALVMDIEIPEGEVQDRFQSLKNCLLTKEKYEVNRL